MAKNVEWCVNCIEERNFISMESQTETITEIKIKEPSNYAVILHNDDITTIEFVIELLIKIFHKSESDAKAITMTIHTGKKGTAGIYNYDIAVTKKLQADRMSKSKGFPLNITLEQV